MFDSIFESGNLLQAEMVSRVEYNLYMQVDTNTKGHQQWFYYKVTNTKRGQKYLFKIMNFTKPGLTGGYGYKKNDSVQRIMIKSEKAIDACKSEQLDRMSNEDMNQQTIT